MSKKTLEGYTGSEVKIYTTAVCKYCDEAKQFFKKNGVKFREYDVTKDKVALERMTNLTGKRSVPVIEVGPKFMVGFDEAELIKALKAYG